MAKATSIAEKALRMASQMRNEFPWLPDEFVHSLKHVAQGKVVIPSLEVDRMIHAVCLTTKVFNRLNAIMCEHVGQGFYHRPSCGTYIDGDLFVTAAKLSQEENQAHAEFFNRLLARMDRLEDEDSPANEREMPVGIYTWDEYQRLRSPAAVLLS